MCFGSHREGVCQLPLSSLQVCRNLLNLNFDYGFSTCFCSLCVDSWVILSEKRVLESGEDASVFVLPSVFTFHGNLNIEVWYLFYVRILNIYGCLWINC